MLSGNYLQGLLFPRMLLWTSGKSLNIPRVWNKEVYLNGKLIEVKNLVEYSKLYSDEKEDDEKDEGDKDEIIKESVEACSTAKTEMRTAANDPDDLYKLSKISPATRKKVYTYWKDYLDYVPDYCKLMTTDFEK